MSDFALRYTMVTMGQFVLAVLLFTLGLPRREHWPARLATLLLAVAGMTALALRLGFAFFPTLTDLGSFVRAIGSFALVFVALCAAVLLLFDVTVTSSLYYASSAYLLQTFTSTLHRLLLGAGVGGTDVVPQVGDLNVPLIALVTALSYAAVYLTIVRRLRRRVVEVPQTPAMTFALVISLAVCLMFDLLVKDVAPSMPAHYAVAITGFSLAICAFVLVAEYEIIFGQVMRAQAAVMERTMAERERQFELSRTTVESINRRCHDMRHQVMRLIDEGGEDGHLSREQLRQIAREINVYDSAVRTGNAALDVVITEKGLLARQNGGSIACIADGSALEGIAPADVYALFGSLLDAAIAATARVTDPERRTVALDVRRRMGMVVASVEHDAPDEGDAPQVPAAAHDIVARLGGTATATTVDGVLTTSVLLPTS